MTVRIKYFDPTIVLNKYRRSLNHQSTLLAHPLPRVDHAPNWTTIHRRHPLLPLHLQKDLHRPFKSRTSPSSIRMEVTLELSHEGGRESTDSEVDTAICE